MRLAATTLICCVLAISCASPVSAAEALPALARVSQKDLFQIMEVSALKPICDSLRPGFKQATSAGYSAWRSEHQAILDELHALPQFNGKSTIKDIEIPPAQRQEYARKCSGLERFFVHSHPDSRFSTPAKTWELYLEALRSGQREVALDCLVDPALSNYGEIIETESLDFLRQIGSGYEPLKLKRDYGDQATYTTVRNNQYGEVSFTRIGGEWKILGM